MYKFIAVLNKKIGQGRLMNALGHMAVGLGAGCECRYTMRLLQYQDKGGGIHPHISYYPFIVLKADNSNQIRTIRKEALARDIPFTDFTDTMTVGTSEEQLENTKRKKEEELEYYGICLFGRADELVQFTSKFSLFQ